MGLEPVNVTAVYRDGSEKVYRMVVNTLAGVRNAQMQRPDKFHISIDDRDKICGVRLNSLEMACHGQSPYDYGERVVFA